MKNFICFLRDKTALVFTWFVFLIVVFSFLTGNKEISNGLLIKTFVVALAMVIFFYISFSEEIIKKKGFLFRMNVFMILTVSTEIFLIIKLKLLVINWNIQWYIFSGIVIGLYISSIGIYTLYSKKAGKEYTNLLNQYKQNRKKELYNE